jgi:amino acid adenylation domain-containing protein
MTRLLQHWISEAAQRRPDSRALVEDGGAMTYRALEEYGNRLARALREAGCRKDDRVAVLMPKSALAVATLTGVLKAGCAYVPLDPAGAVVRTADMLRRCQPRALLVAGGSQSEEVVSHLRDREVLRGVALAPLDLDTTLEHAAFTRRDADGLCGEPLPLTASAQDVAYILFTSGSTGRPKGVPITHANVLAFIDWAVRCFSLGPEDRLSGHTELTFDLSTFDIFATFAAGAELHPVPRQRQLLPRNLIDFIAERELTLWFSVPSQLAYVARFDALSGRALPCLRQVAWCGDVLPTPSLIYWRRCLPGASFTNLYGPTETTVASSYYRVPESFEDETADIPIGVACDGEELLVLDDDLTPVPDGEVGEIYIRGVGLSRGYWCDEARTAEAFLPDPANPAGRIYRTGDVGRRDADGNVRFLGRADFQIKTSGYRVEPAEVENAILRVEGVAACAVVPVRVGDFFGSAVGCAYVPSNGDGDALAPRRIKRQLEDLIPSYMIPSRWTAMQSLPIDTRGKVDRAMIQRLLGG